MAGPNDELRAIKEWYRYNSYVRKILDVLEKLPEAEVTRHRGASFPTMIDSDRSVNIGCEIFDLLEETPFRL